MQGINTARHQQCKASMMRGTNFTATPVIGDRNERADSVDGKAQAARPRSTPVLLPPLPAPVSGPPITVAVDKSQKIEPGNDFLACARPGLARQARAGAPLAPPRPPTACHGQPPPVGRRARRQAWGK